MALLKITIGPELVAPCAPTLILAVMVIGYLTGETITEPSHRRTNITADFEQIWLGDRQNSNNFQSSNCSSRSIPSAEMVIFDSITSFDGEFDKSVNSRNYCVENFLIDSLLPNKTTRD